jgi:16S rRNA A1518/A1519 N6-dimethyltransferase RsmA/KsgA/DIM1 with predicted DNA glycosylase/AP lyase activity
LHRRKNLRGVLHIMARNGVSKDRIDERLRSLAFDPMGRAEALTIDDHLRLCERLSEMCQGTTPL